MKHLLLSAPLLLLLNAPALASQGHVYRDDEGAISVYRLEPNAQVRIGIDEPPSRTLTSNPCGLLVVSASENYPTATIQVNRATINPASLPTQIRPACRQQGSGYDLDEARPQHFKTQDGDVVVVGNQPNTRYEVTYPGQLRILSRRVNDCGFLRVRETNTINFNQSILLPTTSASTYAEFQIDQIPQTRALLCYRGNLYYPQPWTDIFATAIPGTDIAATVVNTARTIASAVATASTGGTTGGGGSTGSGGSSTGGGGGSSTGGTGDSSGSTGGTGGSSSGSSSGGAGDTGGSSNGGSSGSTAAMTDFTLATYDPSVHDFNGDGLVDDSNGDGLPDDRDSDGYPDGPWGPEDMPRSAGPGMTVPLYAYVCFAPNGSIVAVSDSFNRSKAYAISADDGITEITNGDNPMPGDTSKGSLAGPPVIVFSGDWRSSNFSHSFEGSPRHGYIYEESGWDWRQITLFQFPDLNPCGQPPWMTNPPNGIQF